MKKMKVYSAVGFACFLWAIPVHAQNIEKEFEDFEKQQLAEFEEFKNKADAEFETFLRETWERYDAFAPVPAPVRPEPPKPVAFDQTKPMLPPVAIKPAPGVYVPEKPYTPVLIEVPIVKPGSTVRRTPIEFYGTSFEVATDAIDGLSLSGNSEGEVADAWRDLCKMDYEQFVKDCMTLKQEKQLNDWAYLLFAKQIGKQLYQESSKNEIVFLQMFLLNKSGYKVRLCKIDDELKLMIATAGTVYGTPYLTLSGHKYYVFEPTPGSSMGIYTYRQNFANAKNLVSLDVQGLPEFAMQEQERTFTPEGSSLTVRTVVNKNLMDFYADYPKCEVAIHYKTPMSEELRTALYSQLEAAIAGKSQKDAANLLLNFVQTAFQYMTDGEQFGFEKPNFPDETFYYPYCDCEDRAMLFSTLVKDLLGLDTILLDYPDHIASAVRFSEKIVGDNVVLEDGVEYLICDPTYIGAPIGVCMDRYKEVAPEIIR